MWQKDVSTGNLNECVNLHINILILLGIGDSNVPFFKLVYSGHIPFKIAGRSSYPTYEKPECDIWGMLIFARMPRRVYVTVDVGKR